MNVLHHWAKRRQVSRPGWGMLEFDQDAAEALGVVTLLATGRVEDADLAERMLDDLLAEPDGARRVVRGMASVSGGLLALLEFFGAVPASRSLGELGRAIANATDAEARTSML